MHANEISPDHMVLEGSATDTCCSTEIHDPLNDNATAWLRHLNIFASAVQA
jgi:hypothetical protein